MSLRAFHLFFIAAAIVMCGLVTAWGVHDYRHHDVGGSLALAALCVLLGLGLMLYWARVYRKFKELGR
ncbi:MAG: hypothetical protein OES47_09650 [Acidobacteriota bacterium]|nr:hypothetical protein [Acidobacteriota bacterium]